MDTKFNLYPATKPQKKGEYLVLLKNTNTNKFDTIHAYFDGKEFDSEKGECAIIVGWEELTPEEKKEAS